MAGVVNKCALLLACCLSSGAWAQTADPTRPPSGWGSASDNAGADGEPAADMRLQSVIMPQRGKPRALIGGQSVTVGGKVGEATLVHLTEKEAVLQGPEGITRLYLAPDVTKQIVVTPKARRAGKSGQLKDSP